MEDSASPPSTDDTATPPSTDDTATPPSPDGVPVFGNGLAFVRDTFDSLERWATLGDVVHLRLLGESYYLVTDPSLVEEVLVERHDRFTISDRQRKSFEGVEDHAVTIARGERWKRLRKALQPAFARTSLQQYGDRMAAATERYVEEWDDGERIDLYREMRLLTLHVLADTLLGVDIRGREDVVMDAADALVDRADLRRVGLLVPDWIPTPTDWRFERTVRALDEFVDGVVSERRPGERGDDVCTVLLAAHERGDLSLDEVRHNLVSMLLAGHESPAVTLTYAWYLLSDHPEVRESLVAEYEEVVDGERPGAGAFDDLERTRNAISETLRLYPPAYVTNRQATEPVTLGGYEFSEGATFLLPQWVLHRDERFWDDPLSFDPSRWRERGDRPEYAYFPFSGGPRQCIGMYFARQELALALATMAARVELDVSLDGPLTFTPSLTLRPETDVEATVRMR